ncbi:neuroguidin-like [Ostrea edulis]|uniref:neuroguidin-like n=1 Tax=Ostrea edulis TaxID=37623 RepID=UPI0024AFFC6C|nr:neuroguidin-like [Ostrea edulis]XP_056014912.1 neuroguidin-like [Ostrea edulis]
MSAEEMEEAIKLLGDMESQTEDVTKLIDHLLKKALNEEYSTSSGISFLEVKYQLLLTYLMNLTYITLQKSSGESIEGDPSIDRLVEIRTVLEKMRPIDKKLKYQVDKVVRTAATGGIDSSDPLRYRANPENLISKLDDESESESEGEEKKPKIYQPPKLTAMHYEGDESVQDKEQQVLERAKKRALSTSMLRDLREEYSEGPSEVRETTSTQRSKAEKKLRDRTEYEEEHFMRFSVSKKDKNEMKRVAGFSSLNNLTHFDDISALTEGRTSQSGSSKKRKAGGKGKKGKKGFKKRRKH